MARVAAPYIAQSNLSLLNGTYLPALKLMHPEFNGPKGRTRIKQRFTADPEPIQFWYPPKWGLNELISGRVAHV